MLSRRQLVKTLVFCTWGPALAGPTRAAEGSAAEQTPQPQLPEVCANLCFGGTKRNRLFMAASQSRYAVYVNTQGAGPA
jgi:sugar lactone lactonase YvrE